MGKVGLCFCLILVLAALSNAQLPRVRVKPGACGPMALGICAQTCSSDFSCPGNNKCCRTECGGTVCSTPVSQINNPIMTKPGSCPAKPSGPWVCSHSCTSDADCRGKLKCCKNRCGALTCQKPEP
ncbi:hypothetical protein J437_LFUL008145 [Ladona fulva]|uniref:WAP domain-containing protein n=1 Tax=Ladona fulva TaxID=123851 RepID=A0A8K0JVQ4_LADFU|nr:hypothetical protein J437_LFUL008145 [Ladona fulva]